MTGNLCSAFRGGLFLREYLSVCLVILRNYDVGRFRDDYVSFTTHSFQLLRAVLKKDGSIATHHSVHFSHELKNMFAESPMRFSRR
jgi:hypothetical protein